MELKIIFGVILMFTAVLQNSSQSEEEGSKEAETNPEPAQEEVHQPQYESQPDETAAQPAAPESNSNSEEKKEDDSKENSGEQATMNLPSPPPANQPPQDRMIMGAPKRTQAQEMLDTLAFGISERVSKAIVDFGGGDVSLGQELTIAHMRSAPTVGPLDPMGCITLVYAVDYSTGHAKTTYAMWLMVNVKNTEDLTNPANEVLPWAFQPDVLVPQGGSGGRFVAVIVTQVGGEFDVDELRRKVTENHRSGFTGAELAGNLYFQDMSHLFHPGAKPGIIIHTAHWVVCPEGKPGCQPGGETAVAHTTLPHQTMVVMMKRKNEAGNDEEDDD